MTRDEFMGALALTQHKWAWGTTPNFHAIRCTADDGLEHCPLTAVADFAGLGRFNASQPSRAGTALGLTIHDIDEIVTAADTDHLRWGRPLLRAELLRATGLA